WIYITQIEAYVRNCPHIDDCAHTTLTDKYPQDPLFKGERKTEHGREWCEIKVFWKKFEFLITGGLYGSYLDNNIHGFLGSSFP
ncbi:hypothetical protein BDF20DRAFT_797743, partial [Mycotypha africana]|uniref:uncharacterized protein n=1 Tax=Mycotypha africana TaxID=64632 RepID=UPI0023003EE2